LEATKAQNWAIEPQGKKTHFTAMSNLNDVSQTKTLNACSLAKRKLLNMNVIIQEISFIFLCPYIIASTWQN
jgi:hypothetical protein